MDPAAARALPESTLVLAAQSRDRIAFEELVRRRERWLRALLRRVCGHPQQADDLAQDTFLRAWQSIANLREPAAFAGWLRRLAVHRFIDARRLRRGDFDAPATLDTLASDEPSPSRTAQAQFDLDRALAQLSDPERLCVVLNLGEGLSHGEIEQATGIPLGTVKSHILRGTAKMRRAAGDAHE
ncbi:MAG TPA: sigma-70 family RNA polymerase sigma factor [Povalibacter sp.]|uniref:RNA polymerase sigma factor n=1 Tax=Povalibacter sp. TaxID=1962978 RepID=UPI002BF631FE|nr:sigma-70 family RNA polymerase sigma factor [Povalibacter sp.]HMN45206.1 sigma-70 family RNA polymerase sigma factor [Povalibacter sp.]